MTENTTPNTDETNPRSPFEAFLFHQRRALEETGKALEALLPEGFREHGAQATREFTKGLRVLMEAAVEEVKKAAEKRQQAEDEPGEAEPPSGTTGSTKVKVQVE
ncbi:MAG: hypothetical protein IT298_07685 [Chloroflexi bacterium]|jgi:hypothetical protein|nr:MAG: hypothetical protein UZ13_00483 [Chloroflexi bacterium OLB13]MBC6957273.1 hypothetical protein [Chloroflexota bacterium]MBV6437735.1 hypothetical protein [Anaerolineae bacterium]MDL1916858.1 hypothetical protein [Anaerolineae bacterium CFX4]OQY82339.1 MAG: hypothetical protein B6D42_09560 [Anaerolineae bacterium UTCFX5]